MTSLRTFLSRPEAPALTALHLHISGSPHAPGAPAQLESLLAAQSPLADVADLTVAFDPAMTMQLLLSPRFRDRGFLQRALAACRALRRLHLHFHLRPGLENALEHLWQQCASVRGLH
jgi:hypothetical protein